MQRFFWLSWHNLCQPFKLSLKYGNYQMGCALQSTHPLGDVNTSLALCSCTINYIQVQLSYLDKLRIKERKGATHQFVLSSEYHCHLLKSFHWGNWWRMLPITSHPLYKYFKVLSPEQQALTQRELEMALNVSWVSVCVCPRVCVSTYVWTWVSVSLHTCVWVDIEARGRCLPRLFSTVCLFVEKVTFLNPELTTLSRQTSQQTPYFHCLHLPRVRHRLITPCPASSTKDQNLVPHVCTALYWLSHLPMLHI